MNLNKTLDIDPSMLKTIDYKLIPKAKLDIKESEAMKEVLNFIESISLKTIHTPLKGTCLQITKDESKIVFSSRSETHSGGYGSQSQESRLAVIDLKSEEVVLDQSVIGKDIWTIALSNDDQFLYAAGVQGIIYKFLITDLKRLDEYVGHSGEVNVVKISSDDLWMLSASDDGTLRFWALDHNSESEILIQTDSPLYAMDLSPDNEFAVTGGYDRIFFVYQLSKNQRKVITTIKNDSQIWSSKISHNCSITAFGDQSGRIRVFKFFTWEETQSFYMTDRISTIDISYNSDILIAGSKSTKIKIIFLKKNQEIDFSSHSDWVKRCALIDNDSRVVSISDDKSIKIWKIPELEIESIFFTEPNISVKKIWSCTSGSGLNGIIERNSQLFGLVFDEYGQVIQDFCFSEDKNSVFYVSDYHDFILCSNKENNDENNSYKIQMFNISTGKVIKNFSIEDKVESLYMPALIKYFIVGVPFKLLIINSYTFAELATVYFVSEVILDTLTDKKDELLFVAGPSNLYYYRITNSSGTFTVKEFHNKSYQERFYLAYMHLTETSQYLYFLTSSFFEVIHVESFSSVIKINEPFLGFFKNINETLFLFSETFINIYSAETFQNLSNIKKDYKMSSIVLSKDIKNIFISTDDKIIKSENPLHPTKTKLIGDYSKLQEFQTYMNSILDKSQDSVPAITGWLIEPAHVNLLHIFSYMNLYDIINESLLNEYSPSIPLIKSRDGFSPLTIAAKMNFIECINSIIKSLIKRLKKRGDDEIISQLLFGILEDDLVSLNLSGYKYLHKLYKYIYITDTSAYLPNCCSKSIDLPIYIRNHEFYMSGQNFGVYDDEDSGKMKSIIFRKSLVRLNFEMGSAESLDFMSSLTNCGNSEVFQTEFICIILKQKWKSIRWIFFIQAFLYIWYLIFLSLYTSYDETRTKTFLVSPFILSLILYLYEITFIIIESYNYFKDPWNIIDTIRSWTMIVYSILVWSNYFNISLDKNEKERYMLAVLLGISWLRGITYFRIIKSTRYLVNLLFQVFIDIVPFLSILFYSILAFALAFRAFVEDTNEDFFNHLTDSYMIIIGNWDNPETVNFYSLILLLATLLNPIISLNLLISILSNTFSQVQESQVVADSQELMTMIVEAETLMFWKRNLSSKLYFQTMERDYDLEEETNRIEAVVKKLKTKVMRISDELNLYDKAKDAFNIRKNEAGAQVKYALNELIYR